MTFKKLLVSALAALILLMNPVLAQASDNKLTPAQIREDLTFLKTQWAPLDKSFTDGKRAEFNSLIDDTMANAEGLSTADFALAVLQAAALAGNGHTVANAGTLLPDLPVRAWWFADGLYIVKAQPQFADLLGARIDKLGDLTAEEALRRASPFISGTDQRIRYLSAAYLTRPALLKRIGASTDDAGVSLTLRLRDGAKRVVTLAPASSGDPGDDHDPPRRAYMVLIPDPPDLSGRWRHVLDGVEKRPPAYAPRVDVASSWLGKGERVLYIRSNAMNSIDNRPLMDKYAALVRDEVLKRRPQNVIVDLRLNNGGNFFNSLLFAQALPKLLPEKGKVLVLVSRATFSAAIVTAAILKGAGGDKVILIGERMGDGGQFWAEGDTKKLPQSGISVSYATEFEDYEEGCTDPSRCYWATVAFGPKGISLDPNVTVPVTFADYAAGRDPVLAKALEMTD